MRGFTCLGVAAVLALAVRGAWGATYYVDFDAGADGNSGTATNAPWKHAPGDSAATENAKAAKIQPGDMVKFKGGVIYRGTVNIGVSGEKGKPVVYDGNLAGDWGDGKAIIDGSTPLEGLKQCADARAAWGNPHFKNIYWTTVPKGAAWNTLNVCQGLVPLAWAQDPNPADPNFQEDEKLFYQTQPEIPRTLSALKVRAVGMKENAKRPLMTMFDGGKDSAVIENMAGGEVEVTLQAPATVVAFSVTPQPKYTNPKEMVFSGDGKELLKVELANNPEKVVTQRFKLPAPATFKTLTIKFVSVHEREGGAKWGAIAGIGAYDAEGKNVLAADSKSVLKNDKVFSQGDADYYKNAFLALYAKPAFVYYKRITGFDPATHTIGFETLTASQVPYDKGGAFSIVNSPRNIDMPGEYALVLEPEKDGSHKLFLWPPDAGGGKPENLSRGQHGLGIGIGGSFVTVQGFWVRKQGWDGDTGIRGAAPRNGRATDVVIKDCKVTNLRGDGVGITTNQIDNLLVEGCEVSDNAGHCKGIVLRNASNIVARGCLLKRNSSTALDFYTVTNAVVQDNTVVENPGMHANGLTFYVGCKDILVERNTVREGNVALTVQDGDGMIIRNNVLEGGGNSPAIGLWSGKPFNDILITNNVLRFHGESDWAAAIYGGNPEAHGYAILNNVIDGVSGNVLDKADMHHNLFTTYGPVMKKERMGDNKLVEKVDELFVDARKGDYHLKAGSPAIDAGVAVTSVNKVDMDGHLRDARPDIGAYEFSGKGGTKELADPHTFKFTMDGYEIKAPAAAAEKPYQMKFKKVEGAESILLKGVDKTGEGGGKVNLRPTKGGYISGWDKEGHWLEWTVESPKGGAYEVVIEHGSEAPGKREVLVNGEAVKGLESVEFGATGSWTKFEKEGLPVALHLKAGKNVVRFVNVGGSHNFKSLEFVPVTE
jgi:hypothetical protein